LLSIRELRALAKSVAREREGVGSRIGRTWLRHGLTLRSRRARQREDPGDGSAAH
jgi:hypothetical protein